MTPMIAPDIPTPALVVDCEVLNQNIRAAHSSIAEAGLRIRPHVKTHKSLEIARRQLAAGAAGLTVATVGEAEIFSQVCNDVFIAYPLWPDEDQFSRLKTLSGRCRLAVGVDSAEGVEHLAGSLARSVELMIEIDSGHHRSGCAHAEAGAIAKAALDRNLGVRGVFTFPGHSYTPDGGRSAAWDESASLSRAADSIHEATGLSSLEISGGSTPSFRTSAAGDITETRPGVYIFNDAQQWELGNAAPETIALSAYARVVSAREGQIVLDAGSKVLGADKAAYSTGSGRLLDFPDARIIQLSEHHAVVAIDDGPPRGSVVRVVPNHVCNAVNLVDELIPVNREGVQLAWLVDARGRNR